MNKLTWDKINIILSFSGLVAGLLLVDLYVYLWIRAYYNGDVVSSDFGSLQFLIMLGYLLVATFIFGMGIWMEKKRADFTMMGWIAWVSLLCMFWFYGYYMKVFCLPFMAG